MMRERLELVRERLYEIEKEKVMEQPCRDYFEQVAHFLNGTIDWYEQITENDWDTFSLEQLQKHNQAHFQDILPEEYGHSYGNPQYAVETLGEEYGQVLSCVYAQVRSIISSCYENDLEDIVIHLELFVQIYCLFYQTIEEDGVMPTEDQIKEILYWFVCDYLPDETKQRIHAQLNPEQQFAVSIIKKADLNDLRYLYGFGEYITQNEIEIANFLAGLEEATLQKIADTITEGFVKGFVLGNKDLSKKKVVNIRYVIGFEQIVRRVISNFEKIGLQVTISRARNSIFHRRGMHKIGYYGAIANRQFEYDHKEDEGLILDKYMINRKLEGLKEAYEEEKEWAAVHAGPACMEVFGENPFVPVEKSESVLYTEEQQQLCVSYQEKSGQLTNGYIKPEERSYTIIAFPVPQIGTKFSEIFQETIAINTLDYERYEKMQQIIIDTLDQAEKVRVVGTNGNRTNIEVALCNLNNPETETKFENCVADVNIPVGEVFTSPKLKDTAGILHVKNVYLNEFEFQNLTLSFEDGMVSDYSCSNFATVEANKRYVKEQVLSRRDTLPMGEFAIGTNTTAYAMGKKYDLEDKLPILIAEKTGPHFAVGDTCYAHSEEIAVYNPNGKEIIARKNGASYVYHHLDITIPYDELLEIVAVTSSGEELVIIRNGKFVLQGLEELNEPLAFIK